MTVAGWECFLGSSELLSSQGVPEASLIQSPLWKYTGTPRSEHRCAQREATPQSPLETPNTTSQLSNSAHDKSVFHRLQWLPVCFQIKCMIFNPGQ